MRFRRVRVATRMQTAEPVTVGGWSVPDFIPLDVLLEHFEPPLGEPPIQAEPQRRGMYEYANEATLPHVKPGEWFLAAKARRRRNEWHDVARYLAGHAHWQTGRNVRCSVQRMAPAIGKERARCNAHVRRLAAEGWLRMTGKAERGVIVYALAIPPVSPEVAHKQ